MDKISQQVSLSEDALYLFVLCKVSKSHTYLHNVILVEYLDGAYFPRTSMHSAIHLTECSLSQDPLDIKVLNSNFRGLATLAFFLVG